MTPLDRERFARVERLFHELVELETAERERRLGALASREPEVVRELRELLRAEGDDDLAGLELLVRGEEGTRSATLALAPNGPAVDRSGAVLVPAGIAPSTDSDSRETSDAGSVLGAYRLVRKLGRGGMGEVWEAEQTEPIERRVAIKLVGRGRPDPRVVARFLAERQALATMDHPHIARVFDAGQTEQGVPYLVMELVQGAEPITTYCDQRAVDLEARLGLFADVCDAIEHAHRKRVIHRDLKPTNVLVSEVDGRPLVKVIDFGIAKPLELGLDGSAAPDLTRHGDLLGTPRYMSPEQAALGTMDVDTRSDVYTLGLILYELLVGELPLRDEELDDLSFDEQLRQIREQDAPRASTRLRKRSGLSTGSGQGNVATESPLTSSWRRLRGDLDRIVAKALEKDRERRYGSAGELAEDVRRFLRDEPVLAAEPSFAYQSAKFFRRHRFAVALALLTFAGVLASLVGTSFGLLRARAAEQRALEAEREARTGERTAEQVADFLEQLLREANPEQAQGAASVQDLLELGEEKLRDELRDEPAVRARLLLTVGRAFRANGDFARAEQLYDEAERVATEAHGARSPQVERILGARSDLLQYSGQQEKAFEVASKQLELANEVYPTLSTERADAILQVAMADWRLGRFDDAFSKLQQSEAVLRALAEAGAETGTGTATGTMPDLDLSRRAISALPRVLNNLAILHWQQGRMDEAAEDYSEALAILRSERGNEHPHVASTLSNLALVHRSRQRLEQAREANEEALRIRRATFEAPHPDIAESLNNLGLIYGDLGDRERSIGMLREALAMRRELFDDPNDQIATTQYNLARFLLYENPDEARVEFTAALRGFEGTVGRDHLYVAAVLESLAELEGNQGNHAESIRHARRARAVVAQALPKDHPRQRSLTSKLLRHLERQGDEATRSEREQLREDLERFAPEDDSQDGSS